MSWNLFNRQNNRSHIFSPSDERDFERECRKMTLLEDNCKKVAKNTKKTISNLNQYGRSCEKLGSELVTELKDCTADDLPWLQEFENSMSKQDQLNQEKGNMIHQSVSEPLKKFSTIFPSYHQQLKQREKSLNEYGKVHGKLQKYEEREHTAANVVKAEATKREMQPLREEFEQKNRQLMREMPQLYETRLKYFQPSIEVLISSQIWFYKEMLSVLADSQLSNIQVVSDDDDEIQSQVNSLLQDVRKLSITSDE